MVELGQKTREYLPELHQSLTGRVVYIHPERRYYTVEFEFGLGRSFRSCFTDTKYTEY